jgi:hypothetical protein
LLRAAREYENSPKNSPKISPNHAFVKFYA